MKTIVLAILLFASISTLAQQESNTNPKLDALAKEQDKTVLQKKLKAMENGTADDLFVLYQYYGKDTAKKNAVTKILLRKYPNDDITRMVRPTLFLNVKEGEPMETLLKSLSKEYPTANLDLEKYLVACGYAEVQDFAKAEQFINSLQDPYFRGIGVIELVKIIDETNSTVALELAAKNLEKVKSFKGITGQKGARKTNPDEVYYEFIALYGKLLFKAGRNEDAYTYLKEAYGNEKGDRDAQLADNYAFLASNLEGKYEEALPILSKAVKEGNFETRYTTEVRNGYAKLHPGEDANAYVAELQKEFKTKVRDKVAKLLVDESAPNFVVKDVNGKTVSLADFKGKTIVLDFWATWCGPCVASFPAMQMAVNRFANDPDVKFLFIHTWEHVADPLKDAKNFLSRRNYQFDLYMDTVDPSTKRPPAAEAFGIKGIPAKFIIDANGRIRFKLEGFEGKAEAAAEEVVQMVELARGGK